MPFEYFEIYPNLYTCLVGKQGNRKSTAKDIARDVVAEVFPDLLMSASVMSREAICQLLGKDDAMRTFMDHTGALCEHRPFAMFINELKNFISIDPQRMVDFLTDIYDRKIFDVGTKNQGSDFIQNPCLNLLACETPEWITARMKDKVISGGFSRRMIYIYETSERVRIPFPTIPPGGHEAWKRVKDTLVRLQTYSGPFTWTEEAREWYDSWYRGLRGPSVPILNAFYESKHIQMLKVAMSLGLADTGERILTREGLELATATIDTIEPGIQELGLSVGRNELVGPTRSLLQLIKFNGGFIHEKRLQALMGTDMNPMEYKATLQHLLDTDQIGRLFKVDGQVQRTYIVLPEVMEKHRQGQSVAESLGGASTSPPTSPPSAAK